MTKTEAYQIMKSIVPSIRDKNIYEAIQIALKALSWECAHEKMISSITTEESKDINKKTS